MKRSMSTHRKKLVIITAIIGLFCVAAGTGWMLFMKSMNDDSLDTVRPGESYVRSRVVSDGAFVSFRNLGNKLVVEKDSKQVEMTVADNALWAKGDSYAVVKPSEIPTGTVLYLTVNHKTNKVEQIWYPGT